jgi:hypothetical protein
MHSKPTFAARFKRDECKEKAIPLYLLSLLSAEPGSVTLWGAYASLPLSP